MSREIRFRAWNGSRMLFMGGAGAFCDFEIHGGAVFEWGDYEVHERDYPLMQYTGLQDKNGQDIYEEHELNHQYGVRFEDGLYILYNISNGDRFVALNEATVNGYGLEVTREYTKVEKD